MPGSPALGDRPIPSQRAFSALARASGNASPRWYQRGSRPAGGSGGRHRRPRAVRTPLLAIGFAVFSTGVVGTVISLTGEQGAARAPARVAPAPAPPTLPPQAPVRGYTATNFTEASSVAEPVTVEIPAIGLTADVDPLGLDADGALEVPEDPARVGWFTGSPKPGQTGPAVLEGHIDSQDGPGAFYDLREMLPGDEVTVHRADGSVAIFQVDHLENYRKDEFPSVAVYGPTDVGALRLITCSGGFDKETGSYRENLVVYATAVTTSGSA